MLHEAAVPEAVAALIVGHQHPTITFGLYSRGVNLAVKAEALAKLKYTKNRDSLCQTAPG